MRSKIQTTLLIAAALSVGLASLAEARVMPRPVARPLPATNLHAVSAFKLPHTAFRLPHYVGAVSAIPPHGPWKPPVCTSADCRGNHGAGSNVNGSVSTNVGGCAAVLQPAVISMQRVRSCSRPAVPVAAGLLATQ
jgi:hypothetical protein